VVSLLEPHFSTQILRGRTFFLPNNI
jgi:hypothetical protein